MTKCDSNCVRNIHSFLFFFCFSTAEWFFNKAAKSKTSRSSSSKCRTQWSPINQAQAAMGQMSKQESGAPACAPAAVISLSVSTVHNALIWHYTYLLKTAALSHLFSFFSLSKVHSEIILLCCAGALGFFCPFALSCYTASKYGENCCLGCLPGGMTAVRTHMRLTYGIQVSCSCPNCIFLLSGVSFLILF